MDDTSYREKMAVKRLRTAVIGTGFMGRVHLEALRRVEFVDVAAVLLAVDRRKCELEAAGPFIAGWNRPVS